MKKYSVCLALLFGSVLQVSAQERTNKQPLNFNQGWQFVKDVDTTNSGARLGTLSATGTPWEKISLPHTPRIEPVQKIEEQWQGTCFYRKVFSLPVSARGKHVAIQFGAAMHEADVYLNGKPIYRHIGGYLPFTIDISDKVKAGKQNCLLVKLNNQDNPVIPPGKPIKDLDFNYYGGIYRNAWLIITPKLYISDAVQADHTAGGGILIHDEKVTKDKAVISIQTEVNNDLSQTERTDIKITLKDAGGNIVASATSADQIIKPASFSSFSQQLTVNGPQLWSPANPYLYTLNVQLIQHGKVVDEHTLRTGIKTIKFERGAFYLNGKKINLMGTNRHQEYPYIGYALSDNDQYRDAWKIKNAGFNFVRCSHYPPSPAYLDACDELWIMVMDAIPGWQFFGNDEFQANSFQNIRDMIHRDRNHASIVLWEASLNETGMSKPYMDKANQIVHTELPFINVYSTGWIDYAFDVFNPARQHLKAPDYWKKYAKNKPLLIAEYGDWEYYAQNAGFNQKEYAGLKSEERNSRQTRGDGQKRMLQQALNYQESHNDDLYGPFIGDANWLMFDYKRGYAPDLETSGIMDIFRLPKFSFYFYQSQAGPVVDTNGFGKPMIFIANYWNDENQKTVKIFSNCNEVELAVNGHSIGKQKPDTDAYSKKLSHPPFTFYPDKFIPGTLTATGFIGGKKVVTQSIVTPGKAYKIKLLADISGKPLAAGKNDQLFVYASITDEHGNLIPTNDEPVSFKVKGPATITGPSTIKAEAGIATVLLKAGAKPGTIKITATANRLRQGELTITSK